MREYITKLNDRNLQRKQATGITNYVLYSLVILILMKVLSLVSSIDKDFNIWNINILIWYSLNFSLALYFLYQSFIYSFNNFSSTRILKYSKNTDSYFFSLNSILMLSVPIIPGIFMIWNDYKTNNLNYSFFDVFLFILGIVNILVVISLIFVKNKNNFNIINQSKNLNDKILSVLTFIVSTTVIIITSYKIVEFNTNENLNKLSIFLICLLSFSTLVIIEKIIDSYKKDLFAHDLENLEYEIYLKNLKDDEIREVLQKKYMGFLIQDWIENKKYEINEKLNNFEIELNLIRDKEDSLKEIDERKFSFEYEGRKKEIEKIKDKLKLENAKYIKSVFSEVKEIVSKDSSLKENDYLELRKLIKLFKRQK